MAEPSREHLAAIHKVLEDSSVLFDFEIAKVARAILTSTEPAVLDAMQDALVRAGRLRPGQWTSERGRVIVRYVTDWQDDPYA